MEWPREFTQKCPDAYNKTVNKIETVLLWNPGFEYLFYIFQTQVSESHLIFSTLIKIQIMLGVSPKLLG